MVTDFTKWLLANGWTTTDNREEIQKTMSEKDWYNLYDIYDQEVNYIKDE